MASEREITWDDLTDEEKRFLTLFDRLSPEEQAELLDWMRESVRAQEESR